MSAKRLTSPGREEKTTILCQKEDQLFFKDKNGEKRDPKFVGKKTRF